MSIEPTKNKVKTSIWKALAQSGFPLNNVSGEQQAKFVNQLTEETLIIVNDVLEEMTAPLRKSQAAAAMDEEEKVIWEGRPFLSLVENYVITSERIKIINGLIGKDIENFELIRVQDIDISQSMGERMMGLGDITIHGADKSQPTITLRNIKDPQQVYEMLRKAWLTARKKYGLIFREEM